VGHDLSVAIDVVVCQIKIAHAASR
jgi:hypothetical protein